MSAMANSNQNEFQFFLSLRIYVSCSSKMKSKQIGIRMSTEAYKICNWQLPSLHYFPTSNAKDKKDSDNKWF